jgi:hypothetical protein
LTLASAVAIGAIVGPAQVASRAVELAIAGHHHPIWTKAASATMVAAGLGLLWIGGTPAMALALYGAGMGLESIARGTLPLALFGSKGFATLIGRLALPSLLLQAIAPVAGAFALETGGWKFALGCLLAIAIVNVVLVGLLIVNRSRQGN